MRQRYVLLLAVALWLGVHIGPAHPNSHAVAFSPDGKIFARANNSANGIDLFLVQSGKLIQNLEQSVGSTCLAFSPDGKILVVGAAGDGTREMNEIWVWDVEKKKVLLTRTTSERYLGVLLFSPDGRTLATGSQSKTCLWDTRTWELKSTLKIADGSVNLAFSPDGKTLVIGSSHSPGYTGDRNERALAGELELWDVEKSQLKHTFQKGADAIFTVAFSPDGQMIASGGVQIKGANNEVVNAGVVRLWDVKTGRLKRTLRHKWDVVSTRFSPDGKTLVSCGTYFFWTDPSTAAEAGEIRLWDIKTERFTKEKQYNRGVYDAVFSPDGTVLAVLSEDGNLTQLWNATMTTLLHTLN